MKFKISILVLVCALAGVSCSDKSASEGSDSAESNEAAAPNPNGVGPISHVELGEIDQAMVAEGQVIFEAKCAACHKMAKRYIGPQLSGVTERRTPEWIMNMILNPDGMVANDPVARQLLMEYSAPMANQNLTEDEARKVLEYFRTIP